ncbi:Integral membrane sensor signal transduction histidine kinase [uncultured Paludibacter sp.]|uniref:histidine kinase n=1 Tax=uncultured Paludibacter sp. TaxID=497635 RepID=A0A653AFN9_9BACT|nr:Integral membrane sensor signal transduction histidine kinase [uncultured Paludibacter sp.]
MIFLLLATITFVQYQRERNNRAQLLDGQLKNYNLVISNYLNEKNFSWPQLNELVKLFPDSTLRVTVIDTSGLVLYDSFVKDPTTLENHKNRPEFLMARNSGDGKAIRHSHSTGKDYYYYATKFPHFYVRSALPYTPGLKILLKTNLFFIYFMVAILILAITALYFITKNFTRSIDRLRLFTHKAQTEEFEDEDWDFPKDELGEISQNMVSLYKQLAKTKNDVNNEREKLIKHLQISQEGLGIFSSEKKEILVNSHFIQYTNFLTEKQKGTSEDIFALEEFQEIDQFIDESLTNYQLTRKRITIEKEGKIFMVQCIVFQDDTFEVSINDITLQEHENELKRQLTQNISHELKTPVASIMGYMESILENPELDAERQHFFVERSLQQAQRLSALLQDISTLNKIEEHRKAFEKELCNISAIVSDVLNDVHLQLEERHFEVETHLHPEIQIRGNVSLIYSIFRNLMDNALTYAGENIRVEINCYREDDDFYYFTFSDNGIGVSEEHLNRIFERFYRVDKGRSRKMGGTGLGLAIVKNAVLYHKGNITAKNTPGGGLTFVFSLKKGNMNKLKAN